MKTIPNNINDNQWGYVLKNNILAFHTGPLSQWYGSFKNQSAPFTISIDECEEVYPLRPDYFINARKFLDYYDRPNKPYDLSFNTAEQAMMFGKAILFHDYETADKILATSDAKTQKALGRQVKNYNDELWANRRLRWVTKVNYFKFKQNEELKNFLISTCKNYILVEASPVDFVWGIGSSAKDAETFNVDAWKGQNLLGKALMRVRDMLEDE